MSDYDFFPSWNSCETLDSFHAFVGRVTDPDNEDYVPVQDRIACFDIDGTLWCEYPLPIQVYFMQDRLKELIKTSRPELADQEDVQRLLSNDKEQLSKLTMQDVVELLGECDTADDVRDFPEIVREWYYNAKHPVLDRPLKQLVYPAMRELIDYLTHHEFRVFLVTASSTEMIRPVTHDVLGIMPERAYGSRMGLTLEAKGGKDVHVKRERKLRRFNDGEPKIISIEENIGKPPVVVFGNSDGDVPMMYYAMGSSTPSFCALVHHTDDVREFAYAAQAVSGKLTMGLDEAKKYGWSVIDMKQDFKIVFGDPE